MNKKITAVITAAFLIAPLSAVNAASPLPKVKSTTAPEGTAKMEALSTQLIRLELLRLMIEQ